MTDDQGVPAILDLRHLSRQTLGDRELELELLTLFEDQCARLVPVLAGTGPRDMRSDAAHTLKGAARAIGAARIGELTAQLEGLLDAGSTEPQVAAITAALDRAVDEVREAANRHRETLR